MAKRTRAAIACARCKKLKVKCSDLRPCKQCTKSNVICREISPNYLSVGPEKRMVPTQGIQKQVEKHSLLHDGGSQNFEEALIVSGRDDDTQVLMSHGRSHAQKSDQPATYVSSLPRNTMPAAGIFDALGLGGYGNSYQSPDVSYIRQQEFVLPAIQTTEPLFAPPQASMGLMPLPEAVAAFLCGLTRPIPHPPPPPNAFNVLLSLASGVSLLPTGHQQLPSP